MHGSVSMHLCFVFLRRCTLDRISVVFTSVVKVTPILINQGTQKAECGQKMKLWGWFKSHECILAQQVTIAVQILTDFVCCCKPQTSKAAYFILKRLDVYIVTLLRLAELCDCSFRLSFSPSVSRITHECVDRRRPNTVGSNGQGWLNFGADANPDLDSGSLIPHHCGMVDFRRRLSISYTVTDWLVWNLAKWLTPTR